MRSNLCNRCGTCVGLGNGKILFQDREGKYYPKIISPLTKEEAKIILNACSGHEFHFPEFNQWLFSSAPHYNRWMGSYENLYIGHANDEIVRSNAGSGGILSALLIYLLEKGEIQGAVSLKMSTDKPWLTEPFIATSKEEILESAQSKYIISSVNEILPQIKEIVDRMLNSDAKPERITISSIGSKLGIRGLLEKHLDKLPKTKAYLDSVKETNHDFRLRRIRWAVKKLKKEGEELQMWKIMRKAGIREEYQAKLMEVVTNLLVE